MSTSTKAAENGVAIKGREAEQKNIIDEDEAIDEEQLEEYKEMLDQLGDFPDKVLINSLSMVAEDYNNSPQSANAIYKCIREPLMKHNSSASRKLTLVYVIDSILKNVKASFTPIIEKDAKTWIPSVYHVLGEDQKQKLKKVWNIWRDVGIFKDSAWKEMGACFANGGGASQSKRMTDVVAKASGIGRLPNGSLKVSLALRREMQLLLDEAQADVPELDRVSLERLADINSDLLSNIKNAAEEIIRNPNRSMNASGDGGGQGGASSETAPFPFHEPRSAAAISESKDWKKQNTKFTEQTHELIHKLNGYVREGTSIAQGETTHNVAVDTTNLLAAASCTASLLTNALEYLNQQRNKVTKAEGSSGTVVDNTSMFGSGPGENGIRVKASIQVDPEMFTNEGVKKKNIKVIASLYQAGLPFVSSADGRRFATQEELSKHLDALFRKSQLEKNAEHGALERDWYEPLSRWTKEVEAMEATAEGGDHAANANEEVEIDPEKFTVLADENQDRCVICGINFRMFFDHEEGQYKYANCREVDVLNDEAAELESEPMLVHATCLQGLGSPEVLSRDQIIQLI